MSALVEIRDLGVAYRSATGLVDVVRGVDLQIDAGRTLGLVGESGSGKSTVARTLLAHLRAGSQLRSGSVVVDGTDVFGLSGSALRAHRGGTVALVAQNAGQALTPSMRIGAQVAEAVRSHGGSSDSGRVAELLEQVRLPDPRALARRYPHELSGGQQQRVAIAMAVAARPRVLVLDEPTTALDVVTQATVLRLVADLATELQAACLLVSHDLGVVAGMADDVAVMQDGVVLERADTASLFAGPTHDYTRRLLASVPRLEDTGLVQVDDDGTRTLRPAPAVGPGAPVVRARDVVVRYGGGAPAVDGVDLDVRRGEILALVGESGSGKSTLAWSLAGLTAPARGDMRYLPERADGVTGAGQDTEGADLSLPVRRRPAAVRRRLQLVFQNADTALNPRASVAGSLRRPLRLFDRDDPTSTAQRIASLLDDVGLPVDFASRMPSQLSGGQRQRVGIARALAAGPEVMIADEVTTALDVSVQAEVLTLIDDLRREHALACLFISHDLAVVRGISDRVVVMHGGRVLEQGPTAQVFGQPQHPYTRLLLTAALDPSRRQLPTVTDTMPWRDLAGWNDHGDDHHSRRFDPVDGNV